MTQLPITSITPRDILRNYKNVFDKVKKTKQPVVVFSHKEPQVAIVSLDDLEKLQALHYRDSTKLLLDFANKARGILVEEKLPKDLAAEHDKYLWGK
jgi:prevent-host-death family protein